MHREAENSGRRRRRQATIGVLVSTALAATAVRATAGGAVSFLMLAGAATTAARRKGFFGGPCAHANGAGGAGGSGGGACELKGSSLTTSILNLSKNIIGAGMLSLPFAMKAGGVLPFLVGIVAMGAINGYSFFLLGWCCKATGAISFGDLWAKVFGAESAWVADLAVFLNNGLALLSYCVLIGDFLSKAFAGLLPGLPFLAYRGTDLVLVGLLLLLPLSLLRDLAPLRPSSMAGLAATWYGFMLLATDAWSKGGFLDSEGPVMVNMLPLRVDAFQSLALFSSAFMAHYNAPKFCSDLRDNTLSRWAALVGGAFGMALFTFIVFGFAGFAIFGFAVEGNVLKNYGGGTKVLMAWLGMGFSVTFTYPLVFNTFRESSAALLSVKDASSDSFRLPFTVFAVAMTVAGGTFLTNVAVVSGIKGAVMSAMLAFVLPALMHLKLTDRALPNPKQNGVAAGGGGAHTGMMRTISRSLIAIGITIGVLALLAMFVFPRTDFSAMIVEVPVPIAE